MQCILLCLCVCVCVLGQSPSHLPPREEGFKTFYEWLKLHKAEFDKVNTCTDMFLYIPVLSCTQSARSGFVLSPWLVGCMYIHTYTCIVQHTVYIHGTGGNWFIWWCWVWHKGQRRNRGELSCFMSFVRMLSFLPPFLPPSLPPSLPTYLPTLPPPPPPPPPPTHSLVCVYMYKLDGRACDEDTWEVDDDFWDS